MPEEFDTLEAELRALKPTPIPTDKRDKILAQLSSTPCTSEALESLECELASLQPTEPSSGLKHAIAKNMGEPRTRKKPPAWPILLVAAAAILAIVLIMPKSPETTGPNRVANPPPPPPSPPTEIVDATDLVEPTSEQASTPLAFSDPRARAMVAAGYRPVSLEQMVLDTHDLGPDPEFQDARQMRVKVLQAIKWNNQKTGIQVDTKQIHEAIIRRDASYH